MPFLYYPDSFLCTFQSGGTHYAIDLKFVTMIAVGFDEGTKMPVVRIHFVSGAALVMSEETSEAVKQLYFDLFDCFEKSRRARKKTRRVWATQ